MPGRPRVTRPRVSHGLLKTGLIKPPGLRRTPGQAGIATPRKAPKRPDSSWHPPPGMPAWSGSRRRHVSLVSAGGRKTSARPNDVEARIPSICTWSVHQAVASRIFFVGGAGDDQGGWNYTERFKRIFTEEGITGFTRLHASHDDLARVKAGALPIADAIFMATERGASF